MRWRPEPLRTNLVQGRLACGDSLAGGSQQHIFHTVQGIDVNLGIPILAFQPGDHLDNGQRVHSQIAHQGHVVAYAGDTGRILQVPDDLPANGR